MSGWQASCPSCGAPVVFGLGSSRLKVCGHCGSAVARAGQNVESYGKLADLIPTPSLLRLGLEGRLLGDRSYRIVGRLQLDHGAGTWDEWLLDFGDEEWAWLSEAQGKFHLMRQADEEHVPKVPFHSLKLGHTLYGEGRGTPLTGRWIVSEVRSARFASAEGELPFAVPPGTALNFADIVGPKRRFGTLDFGAQMEAAEALYIGQELSLEQLGIRDLPTEEERRQKARAADLACPQCGGPLELRAPDLTQRVACPWCGSLLDATKDLAVLGVLQKPPVTPLIPLGTQGRIRGVPWTVIGFMERSVTVEGIRYPWQEYLLYEPRSGFRWLVDAKGHWSFVEPVHVGDVEGGSAMAGARYEDRKYKHFQSGEARVDHVLGEFYWAVAQGDKTHTQDFVSPPLMLSMERTNSEMQWSQGTYMPGDEVWRAFRMKGDPPEARGVGPHQPWLQKDDARSIYRTALKAAGALLVIYLVFLVAGGRRLVRQDVTIPQGAGPGAAEAVHFTEAFEVSRQSNVQVNVEAPVSNSWLYLDGALIDEGSGDVHEFDVEVSYYFGRDSDGAWTEGGTKSKSFVPAVPAGRYVMRLAPQWGGATVPRYALDVRQGVPRFTHVLLGLFLLAVWPLRLAWRHFRFEMARWSESDHPWSE